jgi:type II secretory pathway pseudopilin PulG
MKSRRSSLEFAAMAPERRAGFSLVELLVSIGLAGMVLGTVTQFFTSHAHRMREHTYRVETQQALRGALDAMTRDIRLAGACLPVNGNFMALAGTDDDNAGDSITIRTGLTRADLSCVLGTLTNQAASGSTTLQVDDASDFVVGKLAYVRDPNGSGEIREVTAFSAGADTVTVSPGVNQVYPAGSSVYAMDQRIYALRTDVDPPLLMLTIDNGDPQPFAAGIARLDVEYILDRDCPTCDVVDLSSPLDTATWWLVNEVTVTARAQSVGVITEADNTDITQTARAKPRNLLP